MKNQETKNEALIGGSGLNAGLERLLTCPFCGAGHSQIDVFRVWTGKKWGDPITVSINHWCEKIEGQPSRKIERIGKDLESAIEAWNMRSNVQIEARPASWASLSNAGLGGAP